MEISFKEKIDNLIKEKDVDSFFKKVRDYFDNEKNQTLYYKIVENLTKENFSILLEKINSEKIFTIYFKKMIINIFKIYPKSELIPFIIKQANHEEIVDVFFDLINNINNFKIIFNQLDNKKEGESFELLSYLKYQVLVKFILEYNENFIVNKNLEPESIKKLLFCFDFQQKHDFLSMISLLKEKKYLTKNEHNLIYNIIDNSEDIFFFSKKDTIREKYELKFKELIIENKMVDYIKDNFIRNFVKTEQETVKNYPQIVAFINFYQPWRKTPSVHGGDNSHSASFKK